MEKKRYSGPAVFLAGLAACAAMELPAKTFIVTNTNDSGGGSFREAVSACNEAGPDTVVFEIPLLDPGYHPETGVWTIRSAGNYFIPDGTFVDGSISSTPGAGTDSLRPGIEIDGGDSADRGVTGFWVIAGVTLRGLILNHFQYAVWISGGNSTVEACYVGTDPAGRTAKPNGAGGILMSGSASQGFIQYNVISGNQGPGLRLFGADVGHNTLHGNRVGTDATGTAALPNGNEGIYLTLGAHDNLIVDNLVSGNNGIGIHLGDDGTDRNEIRGNRVGTDSSGANPLPNAVFGVALFNGPSRNVIGPGNRVAFNGQAGVLVDGSGDATGTVGNTISGNSITGNRFQGIANIRGGNTELAPPAVQEVTADRITGTAGPLQTVSIYFDGDDEGDVLWGSAVSNERGEFSLAMTDAPPDLPHVTATATDGAGNTSNFSEPFSITGVDRSPGRAVPGEFALFQNHPNPFNPSTKIRYSVPAAGAVKLTLRDALGRIVGTLAEGFRCAGVHEVSVDASSLPSGVYFCNLEAGGRIKSVKLVRVM